MSPEGGGNRAGTRILIVKLSAVGDVVHALPVLHALRTAMPDAHIAWAVHPGPANLLEAANTMGLPLYARQHLDEKGRWIDLMTEASILPVNKRPRIAIRIHTSN